MLKRIGKDARKDFCRRVIRAMSPLTNIHMARYVLGVKDIPDTPLEALSKRNELARAIRTDDLSVVRFYHESMEWYFEPTDANIPMSKATWKYIMDVTPNIDIGRGLSNTEPDDVMQVLNESPYLYDIRSLMKLAFSRYDNCGLRVLMYAREKYPDTWKHVAFETMFSYVPVFYKNIPCALRWMLLHTSPSPDIMRISQFPLFVDHTIKQILSNHQSGLEVKARFLFQMLHAAFKWIGVYGGGDRKLLSQAKCIDLRISGSPYGKMICSVVDFTNCGCHNSVNHL